MWGEGCDLTPTRTGQTLLSLPPPHIMTSTRTGQTLLSLPPPHMTFVAGAGGGCKGAAQRATGAQAGAAVGSGRARGGGHSAGGRYHSHCRRRSSEQQ
eukprot:5890909-Pyramimonas_sp.AAC.1